jgi:nitrogen fixation protein NifX
MKVAFATTDGVNVDEHFGRAGMFAVYEVSPGGYQFAEARKFADGRDTAVEETRGNDVEHDNIMRSKVERLSDCKIVYLTNIGGPSAARLVGKGMMLIKVKETVPIEQELHKLLETIRNSPPPWLKKAINSE